MSGLTVPRDPRPGPDWRQSTSKTTECQPLEIPAATLYHEEIVPFPTGCTVRRFRRSIPLIILLTLLPFAARPQGPELRQRIIGSAFAESQAHRVLERLTDEAGGRLTGSPQDERGLRILSEELKAIGLHPTLEPFTMPGWIRGDDELLVTGPFTRRLRSAALGYTDSLPAFEDTVVVAGYGYPEEFAATRARGNIAVVSSVPPQGKPSLLRTEVIRNAAAAGARALCFINDKPGGLLMCGVANFQGKPAPIPAFSITFEEGSWIERLWRRSITVTMRITTRSRCAPTPTANLSVSMPGTSGRTIVVGAHTDGWDIGQGGVDNGFGSAVLFDVARILALHAGKSAHTITLVWFNGEEQGLWGSTEYVRNHAGDPVLAMVNLDMTGSPRGFNAGGFSETIPLLESVARDLAGFALRKEAWNSPGTNSDHQPFMLRGIPSVSVSGRLDPEKVRYYHDFGDTFDKVDPKSLAEASAVVAVLVQAMANADPGVFKTKSPAEVAAMLRMSNLDTHLKKQQQWPFD